MIDDNAKKSAKRLLSHYRIASPTLDNIIFIIESKGFEIIDYGTNDESYYDNAIINKLASDSLKNNKSAWTYVNGDLKIVFVYEDLSLNEKTYVLAHELGHIECGHVLSGSDYSAAEEQEANEFTHYFLNPHALTKGKNIALSHKKVLITAFLAAFLITVSAVIGIAIAQSRNYYEHYYVTDSGEKYHRKNCIVIEGKNKHRLTEKEYNSGKYEPCRLCLPEE